MSDKTTIEEWLYAGMRLGAKDKPYHVWIDPAGEELTYTKLSGGMPGQAYHVEVDRTDEKTAVFGAPRYRAEQAKRHATDAQVEKWRAEDRAAKTALEAIRLEKAIAGDTELDQALEVIRRHYARLRSYAKRGHFVTYVTGEMQRPPRKEEDDAAR